MSEPIQEIHDKFTMQGDIRYPTEAEIGGAFLDPEATQPIVTIGFTALNTLGMTETITFVLSTEAALDIADDLAAAFEHIEAHLVNG